MTGVRCSRNHPARIDENNRNCSENSARPDSIKISHLLLTTPPRRAEPPSECATTKQAIRSAGSVRPSGLRPRFLSLQLPQFTWSRTAKGWLSRIWTLSNSPSCSIARSVRSSHQQSTQFPSTKRPLVQVYGPRRKSSWCRSVSATGGNGYCEELW